MAFYGLRHTNFLSQEQETKDTKKYQHSNFSDDDLNDILTRLELLMESDKLFVPSVNEINAFPSALEASNIFKPFNI